MKFFKIKILTFVLFSANALIHAQSIKEDFINEFYKEFVDSVYSVYNLRDEASRLNYNFDTTSSDFIYHYKCLINIIPKKNLIEIVKNAAYNLEDKKWNCSKLKNVNCIDYDNASSYLYISNSYGFTPKMRKQRKLWNKKLNNKSIKDRGVYCFSSPAFDNNNEYALIEMKYHYGTGIDDGHGCTLAFRKVNGKWEKIHKFDKWGMDILKPLRGHGNF